MPKLWIATKVWTRGREAGAAQIADSMQKLRTERLELLQIHNLLDWREHLPTVRGMKDAGKLRYIGRHALSRGCARGRGARAARGAI